MSSEDQNANRNSDHKDWDQEMSYGNRILLGIELQDIHVT
jgi:hypothetical protein